MTSLHAELSRPHKFGTKNKFHFQKNLLVFRKTPLVLCSRYDVLMFRAGNDCGMTVVQSWLYYHVYPLLIFVNDEDDQ